MKKALGTTLRQIKTWPDYCVEKSIRSTSSPYNRVNKQINNKLSLWKGDVTKIEADAIVNTANSRLLGGGGVDGAVHAAAGKELLEECKKLGGAKPGEAKITKGYLLPVSYIIHAVGPQDIDPAVLTSTYENSLSLTKKHSIKSIAFPCIATGIFGFPHDKGAEIAARVARQFLNHYHDRMDRIVFIVQDQIDIECYETELPKFFPLN